MSHTLFIGDSHTAGYWYDQKNSISHQWETNYADIYSKKFNTNTLVYAQPGVANQKYVFWLKSMFNRFDNIDKVFIQSTYWNRWLMGASKNLDYGDGTPVDMFLDDTYVSNNKNIKYFTDWRSVDNYIEVSEQCRPELFEEFKGLWIPDGNIDKDWQPFHESYPYSKLWHESITHLQYRDFLKDLYLINAMCKEQNVKAYMWTINNRVYFPEHLNMFGELDFLYIPSLSAQDFIMKKFKVNIEDKTIDGEHYQEEIHNIIAEHYIPYLIGEENEH